MFSHVNASLATIVWGVQVQAPSLSPLSPDEKLLYNKIGKDVLSLHADQRKNQRNSEERVLIFRQSKSWCKVETLLSKVPTTDAKIVEWVKAWNTRIDQMRIAQKKVQRCTTKIAEGLSDFKICKHTNHDKAILIQQTITNQRKIKQIAQQEISHYLTEGMQSIITEGDSFEREKKHFLGTMKSEVESSAECENVIRFIQDNWSLLTLFSDWPEVSLDEERLYVQLKHLKKKISKTPYEDILRDQSVKGIFAIKSLIGSGETLSATVAVEEQHFAKEPTSPKKQSSSLTLVHDAYLFNCDFAQTDENFSKLAKTNAMAEKLERIVTMALNRANVILNPKDLSSINWDALKFGDDETKDDQAKQQPTLDSFNRFYFILDYFKPAK